MAGQDAPSFAGFKGNSWADLSVVFELPYLHATREMGFGMSIWFGTE